MNNNIREILYDTITAAELTLISLLWSQRKLMYCIAVMKKAHIEPIKASLERMSPTFVTKKKTNQTFRQSVTHSGQQGSVKHC